MKFGNMLLATSAVAGAMMAASSAWAAPTLFTDAGAFVAANPGVTTYGFPYSAGLVPTAPNYTLDGVSFVTPVGAFVGSDGFYGGVPYFDAGYPLTVVTANEALGLYIGSFNGALTVDYTYNGVAGVLELAAGKRLSFLGFNSNGGPLTIAFANPTEIDVTEFLTTAPAVPEPAVWAMFIAGMGLTGAAMRRRQRVAVRFA